MIDCKPVTMPMATTSAASSSGGVLLSDPARYRSIVGALQYITLTRPDVAYSINQACQFMYAPSKDHWTLVKRILRYLQGTKDQGLFISRSDSLQLQAFSDVDWAGDSADRKSKGGYAIYMGPNLISWSSKKQNTVACASTESEYKAIADACAELTSLHFLFAELSIPIPQCQSSGVTILVPLISHSILCFIPIQNMLK
ncbi:secreted RxLR effector protein 161-like [Macadamia integrifolia]|uniref:secreted RxLR effector protein 161-like n=1 Tax=Macadamia integrifolia TaxID=60698 RepID=UPI001C4FDA87|nr:secreted RxLR effector protein 161-like [Macadamia integrifolia]